MVVHVVGNACMDATFRLPRMPAPGETVNAVSFSEGLGGKGVNQAVAAARAGASVTLWTAIGNDAAADAILNGLTGELALVEAMRIDRPSDRSAIAVDSAGDNYILSAVACARAYDPLRQAALASSLASGDLLVLQGNLCTDVTDDCLRAARQSGATTLFNASPLDDAEQVDLTSVDILVVNAPEAKTLTGRLDPHEASLALRERGAGTVIITLGADGALVRDGDDRPYSVQAPKVDAVDTSGAGDVFCGVVVGALTRGLSVAAAARVATDAAALAVRRAGTLASCPSRQEMAEIFARENVTYG